MNDNNDTKLNQRIDKIKNKIVVLSGKGGVGKSTVSVNLAVALMLAGKKTGLLDVDIHGPSVPKLLGLSNVRASGNQNQEIEPVLYQDNLKVLSTGFFLEEEKNAIIWRGPRKYGFIKQILSDANWGDLDYMIVDAPPGTGDEPMAVCQLLKDNTRAIIVTTPQDLALSDVRKSVTFCRELNIDIIGVVENLSGFVCPECNKTYDIFRSGGGKKVSQEMGLKFLGSIPIEPKVSEFADSGKPFVNHLKEAQTTRSFLRAVSSIIIPDKNDIEDNKKNIKGGIMKAAIPCANGKLCMHFGHCQTFAIVDFDPEKKEILKKEEKNPPPHEPGVLPKWLADNNVEMIFAGGMGSRAQALFNQNNIKVITGVQGSDPEDIVRSYINDRLVTGTNACDH